MEITPEALKQAVKQGVVEALQERSDLLQDAVCQIMEEDQAMLDAIREADKSGTVSREQVFRTLRSQD